MSNEGRLAPSSQYEVIADELRQQIQRGDYEPGDRLPSVRELASAHAVGNMTAAQALRVLESEGFLVSKDRRGFFVQPPEEWGVVVERPTIEALAQQVKELHVQLDGALERVSEIESLLRRPKKA